MSKELKKINNVISAYPHLSTVASGFIIDFNIEEALEALHMYISNDSLQDDEEYETFKKALEELEMLMKLSDKEKSYLIGPVFAKAYIKKPKNIDSFLQRLHDTLSLVRAT